MSKVCSNIRPPESNGDLSFINKAQTQWRDVPSQPVKYAPKHKTIMLFGPGRWGTTTPSIVVPVSFAEINTVSVLCEIDTMHEGLVPDLSLGTHFFNDLVEMDMLYIGFYSSKKENVLNKYFFNQSSNSLKKLLPEAYEWFHAIKVIDTTDEQKILFSADTINQNAVLYVS